MKASDQDYGLVDESVEQAIRKATDQSATSVAMDYWESEWMMADGIKGFRNFEEELFA